MTATRGDCQVCGHNYALVPSTGMVRAHRVPGARNMTPQQLAVACSADPHRRCPGSYHPPRHALPTTRKDTTMDYRQDDYPDEAPAPTQAQDRHTTAAQLLVDEWVDLAAAQLQADLPYVKSEHLRAAAVDVVAVLTSRWGQALQNAPVQ